MNEEPPPIPRVRAITGIFVESGIVMLLILFFAAVGLARPELVASGREPEMGELMGALVGTAAVFVGTLWVAHLVVGRAGSAPTRRWVAWECLRYTILGIALGLFMSVAFTSSWLEFEGIVSVLVAVALVPVALLGVGRMRRWRDRVYREQLLQRVGQRYVVVEGVVLDSRSSGRMTYMTTIEWRDASGTARHARIVTAGTWSRLAPVSLIMRSADQTKLVHASQQIG